MRHIEGFIWEEWVVEKLDSKHSVEPEEVEEVFFSRTTRVRKIYSERYLLYGQASSGRYLFVVFVWIEKYVKVISARDMTGKERRYLRSK